MVAEVAKQKEVKEKVAKEKKVEVPKGYLPRLKKLYKEQIVPQIMEKFKFKNPMQVPRLIKIVVNMGVGAAKDNPKLIDAAVNELGLITGQKPVVCKARKAIASFKLRAGVPIGCKVTLRDKIMYEFLDRFINIALPRSRDFKGIPMKGFDGRGNYTIGIKEEIIFPEVNLDKIEMIKGMNISFVTTAKSDEECMALLEGFGMPFEKKEKKSG